MRLTRLQAIKLADVLAAAAAVTEDLKVHGSRERDRRRRAVALYRAAAECLLAGEELIPGALMDPGIEDEE